MLFLVYYFWHSACGVVGGGGKSHSWWCSRERRRGQGYSLVLLCSKHVLQHPVPSHFSLTRVSCQVGFPQVPHLIGPLEEVSIFLPTAAPLISKAWKGASKIRLARVEPDRHLYHSLPPFPGHDVPFLPPPPPGTNNPSKFSIVPSAFGNNTLHNLGVMEGLGWKAGKEIGMFIQHIGTESWL